MYDLYVPMVGEADKKIPYEEAKKIRSDFIGTEHLLIGIIKENDSMAGRILTDLGIDITKIYKELVKILNL